MLLDNIRLFLTIVEKGALAAAARELGLAPATVSERLAALEAHYGVVLLNRTTRAIRPTAEGEALIDAAHELLEAVDELDARIRLGATALSGRLRVSAPSDLGRTLVAEALDRFVETHPQVRVELLLADGFADLVGDGFDLAVRFGLVPDSSLRAREIGRVRRLVCAAPSYVEERGTPVLPADLVDHDCIVMRFGTKLDDVWRLGRDETTEVVTVRPTRVTNDGALARRWAVEGKGVVLKSELDVAEDLKTRRLVQLLPGCATSALPLQVIFPPGRAQPRRVAAFADTMVTLAKQRLAECTGRSNSG